MDIREFAPRHATYIDYLKEQERTLAIQLGVAIADKNKRRTETLDLMLCMVRDAINKEDKF